MWVRKLFISANELPILINSYDVGDTRLWKKAYSESRPRTLNDVKRLTLYTLKLFSPRHAQPTILGYGILALIPYKRTTEESYTLLARVAPLLVVFDWVLWYNKLERIVNQWLQNYSFVVTVNRDTCNRIRCFANWTTKRTFGIWPRYTNTWKWVDQYWHFKCWTQFQSNHGELQIATKIPGLEEFVDAYFTNRPFYGCLDKEMINRFNNNLCEG